MKRIYKILATCLVVLIGFISLDVKLASVTHKIGVVETFYQDERTDTPIVLVHFIESFMEIESDYKYFRLYRNGELVMVEIRRGFFTNIIYKTRIIDEPQSIKK